MKSRGALLAMSMMMAAVSIDGQMYGRRKKEPEINAGGDDKALRRYREKKGLKEFVIDGKTVWARNYENAKRKANNLPEPPKS